MAKWVLGWVSPAYLALQQLLAELIVMSSCCPPLAKAVLDTLS